MLKGHQTRVIYHQVYEYAKNLGSTLEPLVLSAEASWASSDSFSLFRSPTCFGLSRCSQFTRTGHVPGGARPLWRAGGPISYEATPAGSIQLPHGYASPAASPAPHQRLFYLRARTRFWGLTVLYLPIRSYRGTPPRGGGRRAPGPPPAPPARAQPPARPRGRGDVVPWCVGLHTRCFISKTLHVDN